MRSRKRSFSVLSLVVVLVILATWAIFENPTRQGLDLQGGTELIYQGRETPANPEIESDDMDRAVEVIRERVDTLGVTEPEISRVGEDQVSVALPEVHDAQDAINQVGQTSQLAFYDFEPNVIPPDPDVQNAEERPFNRLYDAVKVAQEQEPECFEKEGERLCTTSGPSFYLFDEQTLEPLAGPTEVRSDLFLRFEGNEQPENTTIEQIPQGTVILQAEAPPDDPSTEADEAEGAPRGWYLLRDRPELTGEDIRNPEQQFDPVTNAPNVTFEFTDEGRQAFQEVTRRIAQRGQEKAVGPVAPEQAANLSDSFAVVLDDEVVSRPIINFIENPAGIDGRTGAQISGNFTVDEAQQLAEFLRIGALPVDLQLISQSTVSAMLGQEALDEGVQAGVAGLLVVVAFLLFYYRFLGLVAAMGLLTYALLFLALIKLIPITMTLPGIAGLVLTIGIASDSNVVIFERIKEEVWKGKSMLSAIATGYRHGIATIIDANVIILITAFILFVIATGGVQGFAFTLGVGTLVALFTAVLFTQAVLGVLGRARFMRSRRFLGAGERKVSWNFDFAAASKWFFVGSGLILVIGALAFAVRGFQLGIDFESGVRVTASLEQPATIEEVRTALSEAEIEGSDTAKIQEVDNPDFGENVIQVQAAIPIDDEVAGEGVDRVEPLMREVLDNAFGLEGGVDSDAFGINIVGPTFGAQIAQSAAFAILFSLLVICLYVALRFEAKYAIPVLIALLHDILLVGGVYALSGREVTSSTVAAMLTVLGLSMYDTIIVFDRIRENVPRMPRAAFSQIANRSMSEILTRTIVTGVTTLFVLVMLLAFGGDTLSDFAFAMAVGVASGFYSSIFIASPVLTQWKEREPTYRQRRAQIVDAMGYVPTFPEDNVVALVDDQGRGDDGSGAGAREPGPAAPAGSDGGDEALAAPAPARGTVSAPEPPAAERDGADDSAPAERSEAAATAAAAKRERRKQRQQKRRRKHGRSR